ncbi:MAG: copper chaperone PCu(A)C [Rhodobiaceae bacterium]|nr:copper chaperone PCu(A)C [Rhodobiaceae bacterium]MCC0054652.1 copper chaperone PCu(A)C [Rhodobiaceae bacterium]
MQMSARRIVAALALVAMAFFSAGASSAHEYETDTVKIGHPWLRVPPPGATVAAAYLSLTGKDGKDDRLVSVSIPVAERTELHTMTMDGGVMKMRPLENGIEIEAGKTVELKPGGMHVMLIGLTRPIVDGERAKGLLTFEKAGEIEVEFVMQTMKDAMSGEGQHGGMQHGGDMKHEGHGMK